MDISLYILFDKDGELLEAFEDSEVALLEFDHNLNAHELAHVDCKIVDKETLFTRS